MMVIKECPCCQACVWHCEWCWNTYHHGERDKDFLPNPSSDTQAAIETVKKIMAMQSSGRRKR